MVEVLPLKTTLRIQVDSLPSTVICREDIWFVGGPRAPRPKGGGRGPACGDGLSEREMARRAKGGGDGEEEDEGGREVEVEAEEEEKEERGRDSDIMVDGMWLTAYHQPPPVTVGTKEKKRRRRHDGIFLDRFAQGGEERERDNTNRGKNRNKDLGRHSNTPPLYPLPSSLFHLVVKRSSDSRDKECRQPGSQSRTGTLTISSPVTRSWEGGVLGLG